MITFAPMEKKDTPKTREEIFAEKADNYEACFSTTCLLREHCLHSLLASYKPKERLYITCVNLCNPQMQRDKNHLINVYSRKRYYEYHNGTRPLTPDVERYVRQTLKNYGWTEEPRFLEYVEDYLW